MTFARSLYGHTAGIAAIRVADGRCVSLGREGRLWVWNLEASDGRGVSIGGINAPSDNENLPEAYGTSIDIPLPAFGEAQESFASASTFTPLVVFDEQRVITSQGRESIDIWRFDL